MQVRIVLVRPLYPGNVGSALRVAANFGAAEMVLVDGRAALDDPDFRRMAMGAGQLVPVRTEPDLDAALRGADVAIATTSSRARDPRAVVSPEEARQRLAVAAPRLVALVFGSEQSGLRHAEIAACNLAVAVPTSPAFPVLNLSHAVAVVLALLSSPSPPPRATAPLDQTAPAAELLAGFAHLEDVLTRTGFLDRHNPARVMDQLRRLLGRSVPSRREVAILRGIAAHVDYLWRRPSSS